MPAVRMLIVYLCATALAGASATRAQGPPADSTGAASDSVSPRIVRELEPVEVRARLRDPHATQTLRTIPLSTVRDLGLATVADAFALQPGVVITATGLSVRGGRPGEASTWIEGVPLDEPFRHRPMTVPLAALRQAELLTGAIDASQGGALAGTLRLVPHEPGARWAGQLLWSTDGKTSTHYDRTSLLVSGPLPRTHWGVAAAGEAILDDTYLPFARTASREQNLLGSFGWRADNRLAATLRLAPLEGRGAGPRFQTLWSRTVLEPYDAAWTVDGWVQPCNGLGCAEGPSIVGGPEPGAYAYRAADHVPITDDRRFASYATWLVPDTLRELSATLGFVGSRVHTSRGGTDDDAWLLPTSPPLYGNPGSVLSDPFYAYGGDVPWFRREGVNRWLLQGSASRINQRGNRVRVGLGVHYDELWLRELDLATVGTGFDSLRTFHAFAPGAHAYAQSRWSFEGFSIDGGLRAEYYDPGPQAQPTPGGDDAKSRIIWSPRVGFAFPISDRDGFSFAYARLRQAPPREYLYDSRAYGDFRRPLGNSGLTPPTAITYDASLQHLLGGRWIVQASGFHREWFDQPGARALDPARPLFGSRYESIDEGRAIGFELALAWRPDAINRVDLAYTYMDAIGSESLAEGFNTGPRYGPRTEPITDRPLDWDVRHTVIATVHWQAVTGVTLDWSTVVRSGVPWTPREQGSSTFDPITLNSARLPWSETTALRLRATHRWLRGIAVGLEVRNLFDNRGPARATLDGYPHYTINTAYDDYGSYRTEGGEGGAFWDTGSASVPAGWVRVDDPRLERAPRTIRVAFEASL